MTVEGLTCILFLLWLAAETPLLLCCVSEVFIRSVPATLLDRSKWKRFLRLPLQRQGDILSNHGIPTGITLVIEMWLGSGFLVIHVFSCHRAPST